MTRTDNREHELAAMLAAAKAPGYPEEHDESALSPVLAAFNAAAAQGAVAEANGFEAATGESAARDARARPALLWWVGNGPAAGGTPRQRTIQLVARCAAALFIVTGGSVAVASAGILPDPIQSLAHHVFGGIGVPAPKSSATHDTPATGVRGSASTGGPKGQAPQTTAIPPVSPSGTTAAGADPIPSPIPAVPPLPGTSPSEDSPTPTSSPSASAPADDGTGTTKPPTASKPPKPAKSPKPSKTPKPAKSSKAANAPKASKSPKAQAPAATQSPA